MRLLHGEFSSVLEQLADERRAGRRDPARPRRLVDAARPARARLLVRGRRAARHAHGSVRRADGARASSTRRDERELADIFRRYGEERYARQIARAIVSRRGKQPFERTGDLVETIKQAIPAPARFGEGHPAKRVFQALRIEVNDELGSLERALPAALEMLRPGGRLAVISFHSLEDRIVKRFLRDEEHGCTCPPDFPICVCGAEPTLRAIAAPRDPARRAAEVARNPRSAVGAPPRGGEAWLDGARGRRRAPRPRDPAAREAAPAEPAEPRRRQRRSRVRAARSPGSPSAACCSPASSSSTSPCSG